MSIQLTKLSTLFTSVLTNTTEGNVEYKTESNFSFSNNPICLFELSLPEGVKKENVKQLLITACKKATLSADGYFKHLDFQTEHFIFSPSFEDECIKVRIGNIALNTEYDLKDLYKIGNVQKEFIEQKGEKERKAFKKIFVAKKNERENFYRNKSYYYKFDNSLKMYSYFETNYITNDLLVLRVGKDVKDLFKEIIDSLFREGLMESDILSCVYSFFMLEFSHDKNNLTFTKDGKINTKPFDTWLDVFTEKFFKLFTADLLVSIKEHLKDILGGFCIDSSVAESIAKSFKDVLESYYNAKADSLKIGNFNFKPKETTNFILHILKKQYFYFFEVLTKVHRIAQSTQQAAEAIIFFNETNIEKFKELLSDYQHAFGDEAENTISQFTDTLTIKLNEAVEKSKFKIRNPKFELLNALKDEKKVLQFTLILNDSKFVYPKFYTFTGDALNPIVDVADVEVYKIINELGREGPQGPKGNTGSQGKKGDTGVSETSPEPKTNFFFSFPYQVFLLLYLISMNGLVVYLILRPLNQREFK